MLTIVIWLVFSMLFAFTALFFSIDVLFHEVLPNDTGAIVVAVISSAALAGLAFQMHRSGVRRKRAMVFLAGLVLLVLQPVAQQAVRASTRASIEASWQKIKPGIEISGIDDELLLTKSGRPIGVRLSFDFSSAHGVDLMMFPHLKTDTSPPFFLEPSSFRRDPEIEGDRHWYDPDRTYRVSVDLLPSTLTRDPATGLICYRLFNPKFMINLKNAGEAAGNVQHPIVIQGVLFKGTSKSLRFRGETQNEYDLVSFAETALGEEIGQCSPAVTNSLY